MFRQAQLIITLVSLETGIPIDMLTQRGKTKNVMLAKKRIRRRIRDETDLSLREIDIMMGGSGKNRRI